MRLVDDIDLPNPLSEDSLVSDFCGVELLNKKGKRNAVERENIDESDSLFDFSKAIN